MCANIFDVVRLNSNRVGNWVEAEYSLGWVEASDYDFSFSTEFVSIQSTILATHWVLRRNDYLRLSWISELVKHIIDRERIQNWLLTWITQGIIKCKVLGCVDILWTAPNIFTLNISHHCHLTAGCSKVCYSDHRDCEVLQVLIVDNVLLICVNNLHRVATLWGLHQHIIAALNRRFTHYVK